MLTLDNADKRLQPYGNVRSIRLNIDGQVETLEKYDEHGFVYPMLGRQSSLQIRPLFESHQFLIVRSNTFDSNETYLKTASDIINNFQNRTLGKGALIFRRTNSGEMELLEFR